MPQTATKQPGNNEIHLSTLVAMDKPLSVLGGFSYESERE